MTNNKVYISAPVTGRDIEERKRYFSHVAEQLRQQGYDPVNPMHNGLKATASHAAHMRAHLSMLLQCAYYVSALDSALSAGCAVEETVATACSITLLGTVHATGYVHFMPDCGSRNHPVHKDIIP